MTPGNGREVPPSAEGEGRLRRKVREVIDEGNDGEEAGNDYREPGAPPAGARTAEQKAPENCKGEDRGQHQEGDERGGGPSGEFPDTHDLASSAVLSLFTTVWFLLFTIAMSGQLPVETYLVMAGLGYAALFVFGFLLGRRVLRSVRVVVGEIARGLPRRTPWHALRFLVSERRRAAAERTRHEKAVP